MKKLVGLKVAMLLVVLILCYEAKAKDLGTHGNTFIILEDNMLELIEKRLNTFEQDGTLLKYKEILQEKTKRYIYRPQPVENIGTVKDEKSWYFDPTYLLEDAIYNSNGEILHRPGTTINPLQHMPLGQKLIFINGDDDKQLSWALNLQKILTEPCKIILVKGSPIEIMRKEKVRIYFDQRGKLIRKLGIKNVPALVVQQGELLKVTEVNIRNDS